MESEPHLSCPYRKCAPLVWNYRRESCCDCAKGESQLPADDLAVEGEFLAITIAQAVFGGTDAAPAAVAEQLHIAKVDLIANCSGYSFPSWRHKADVAFYGLRVWDTAACTRAGNRYALVQMDRVCKNTMCSTFPCEYHQYAGEGAVPKFWYVRRYDLA